MKENFVTETWRASLAIEAIDSVAIAAIHATDSMAKRPRGNGSAIVAWQF